MENPNRRVSGADNYLMCWAMAALAGAAAFVLLIMIGDWSILQAIFGAGLIFVLVGGILSLVIGRPLPPLSEIQPAPTAPSARVSADVTVPPGTAPSPGGIEPSAISDAPVDTTGDADTSATPTPAQDSSPPSESDAAPVPAVAPSVAVSPDHGVRPAKLDGPRPEGADDLKRIKGVGPKMEQTCNDLGFYHFDQIAAWTPAEVAWVDENLEGFKGRVSRDDWVEQAKLLAAGGETEFSRKVDEGNTY